MATVRKRGNTYQIRVSCGYDVLGKHIEKTMTWKPKQGMTQKKIDKELNRQAVMFEEKCMTGQFLDGNITFAEFTERWFRDYAEKQLRSRTVTRYKELMQRITPAIGHIKVYKLQPHHLMEFYNNLGEDGIRIDTKYTPCKDFKDILIASGYTQKALSEKSGVSLTAIRSCINGNNVSMNTADKITSIISHKNLFKPANGKTKLSNKTIAEYHRLISSILTAAVQWQVIPSNPCNRVKPPKAERKEAVSLDEVQAAELISCLQSEPIKYRTAVMLTLYTGLRRGEVCGLNWSDIDFKNSIISINKSVLYSADRGVYEDTTKTKSSNRIINIPSDMIKLLKQYQTEQMKQQLAMGDMWIDSGKIFTSTNGSMINPDTLSTWFKGFIRRHNLPDIHYHNLRHTAATLLIAGGVDIATVSKRLGHADRTTTLNIYTHAIKSADKAAAYKLQDIFNHSKIS
ncbi:tyrosine-type recombinase/integrase [Lachnospiraceae bacterium MD329]|nr:tyrosine-type recombinase/integrase [Lachnospiraceae bacterium MD329]